MFYVACTLSSRMPTFSPVIEIAHSIKFDDVFGVDFPEFKGGDKPILGGKIRVISESEAFLKRLLASLSEIDNNLFEGSIPMLVPEDVKMRMVRGITPKNKTKDAAKKLAFLMSKGATDITPSEFKLANNPSITIKSSKKGKVVHIIDVQDAKEGAVTLACNSYGYCLNIGNATHGCVPTW